MSERIDFFIKGREELAEPYHYVASGLDNIYLRSGVLIEDTAYGPMVTIENINGLHMAIGLYIVEKPTPMDGSEFRFLRKQMSLTQKELAELMSITDQTIANYEKGKTTLGPADPLMRLVYLVHILPEETRAGLLKAMTEGSGPQRRLPDVPRERLVRPWLEKRRAA